MRYMRCKCGKHESWTTMGSPPCRGCEDCGTTLAEEPEGHTAPIPHDWRDEWKIDPQTGRRWQERFCITCLVRVAPEGMTETTLNEGVRDV